MPVDCQRSTSGGKGNLGMFIERDPKVCAAGLPTAQPDDKVSDFLQHYLLIDEVSALVGDAIIPPKPPRPLPPLRKPIRPDMRYAGPFCDVAQLVNPQNKTKFQTLVDDFKETPYKSYWKSPLGQVQDSTPMLPEGFDVKGTCFGKPTPYHGRLYDIVMPKIPYPDNTPESKKAGYQHKYKYCEPPYKQDVTWGHRTDADTRGTHAKCCLTDDRVKLGLGNRTIINTVQANFQDAKQPRMGTVLAPNDNIQNVPKGYAFGKLKPPDNLPECLTFCEQNAGREFFLKCLKHLNTLRKFLSRRFLPTFYRTFYLNLRYYDKENSGWLPKKIVYAYCGTKLIRFDPTFIEPLLDMWKAFQNDMIEYKTFVLMLNYKQPLPQMPKIPDLPADCLDFKTTYTEMVKPGQPPNTSPMAGLPSGRYFDLDFPISPENCCRAARTYLPHESDMKSCLNPSVLTLLHVNHRDMYAQREPGPVRRVFEAAGEKFTEEGFNALWEAAKKYHSQGWVCYETFRQALLSNPELASVQAESNKTPGNL